MQDFKSDRARMVTDQIHARGVRDPKVLGAMASVERERFVPSSLESRAYQDAPLPIAEGQTISQPYIVAFMVEALVLQAGDRVLEVGAGCGYAAAVMAEMGAQVFTIERHETLAQMAAHNLTDAGYTQVQVIHADGTLGWEDASPFDAILVSAGGPGVPEALTRQLKIGGRLVIPVGSDPRAQELVRITRRGEDRFEREDLADVRFVPLIGAQGWELEEPEPQSLRGRVIQKSPRAEDTLPEGLRRYGESFDDCDQASLDRLLARIGDARIVLIGEASHGTSEFYRMRERITRRLIADKGFNVVAAEADWPDAARIDHYVRHREVPPSEWTAFARFPTWMWRNEETRGFVDWLHEHNSGLEYSQRTGFYGLDLYSLYASIRAVLEYLENVDPELAEIARFRYGCLSPWESDPAAYGHAAVTGRYKHCENDVAHVLAELLQRRFEFAEQDSERFLDAAANAQVVADAENYYRIMYYGSRASWNLRDSHMFETLKQVMASRGEGSKAVVWAHNSHVGDARATEMSIRGEHNIGQLCATAFGASCFRIGFGTDHGTVAAASDWDGPLQIKTVQPSHPQSYEYQFHRTGLPGLMLPMRDGEPELVAQLRKPRLERAIGVIYRPETELASHYFEAELPRQFDEYIWVDETQAVTPLETRVLQGVPDTYPFGT
jgi:protein-L-isoaspartate(D-aspartate) O-methyltransferase